MIQQSTFDFLKKLKKNNNKEWFDKNRKTYEAARNELIQFLTVLIEKAGKWDERLKTLDPKKSIFRINRDIRFSANKDPYKTNMGAWLSPTGKNSNGPGYYLHLEPGGCFIAGGIYMPEAPVLKAIRQEIDYNFKDFQKLLKQKDFKNYFGDLGGEKLKTTPKDYDKDNPAIEYLKLKSFTMIHHMDDSELTEKDIAEKINKIFKAMQPMNLFLASALETE